MPEPAPASWMGRLRLAVVASGPQMHAPVTPMKVIATHTATIDESGVIRRDRTKSVTAKPPSPSVGSTRGWMRSTSWPTGRASTIDAMACGAMRSAASVGV